MPAPDETKRAEAITWDEEATRARGAHRFDRASEAYDQAILVAHDAGEARLLAAALYKAGRYRLRRGQIQAALGALEAGLRTLAGQDPRIEAQLDALRGIGKSIEPVVVTRGL